MEGLGHGATPPFCAAQHEQQARMSQSRKSVQGIMFSMVASPANEGYRPDHNACFWPPSYEAPLAAAAAAPHTLAPIAAATTRERGQLEWQMRHENLIFEEIRVDHAGTYA